MKKEAYNAILNVTKKGDSQFIAKLVGYGILDEFFQLISSENGINLKRVLSATVNILAKYPKNLETKEMIFHKFEEHEIVSKLEGELINHQFEEIRNNALTLFHEYF